MCHYQNTVHSYIYLPSVASFNANILCVDCRVPIYMCEEKHTQQQQHRSSDAICTQNLKPRPHESVFAAIQALVFGHKLWSLCFLLDSRLLTWIMDIGSDSDVIDGQIKLCTSCVDVITGNRSVAEKKYQPDVKPSLLF